MSNNQSKLSRKRFGFKYNSRKLSLKTRIEIIRKNHLIREAKRLLQQGMETPKPSSYQDDYEKTIRIEVLAEILERNTNYEKTQKLLEYTPTSANILANDTSSSDSDNYDSDKFETESLNEDSEDPKKLCLVDESPELVEL